MVFFNYATMQMAAKIVYYGPGLCGKTTNLRYIYEKTSPQSRGEMVSLETETDRTLFFDLLPLDVGVIGGFKTRLQLYTVPGQVFYNTTRKLVLKGVDGIVFVADSQRAMLDANVDSFRNLRDNLTEIGLDLDEIPLVIQLNKRDLPNVAEPSAITSKLDPDKKYEAVESSAMTGTGVFDTLKVISKLTLRTLRKRMTGDEAAPRVVQAQPRRAAFQVREVPHAESRPAQAAESRPPAPAVRPEPFPEALGLPQTATADAETDPPEAGPIGLPPEEHPAPEHVHLADIDADFISAAPIAPSPEPDPAPEPQPEPAPAAQAAPPAAPLPSAAPEEAAAPAPEVRRLKVRSSIDIMAELEQLRKRATQTSAVRRQESGPRAKEAARKLALDVSADAVARARRIRVELSFEEDDGTVVQKESRTVELEEDTRLRTLTVDLTDPSD
jgi:mutual gliding-motility protein MglA